MKTRKLIIFRWVSLVLGIASPHLFSASTKEVVVYTSVDDVFARPIAEDFQKQTGIIVKLVPDTEETKSTGLLNRLIAEKERPQADVFWSGDPVRTAILKNKGVSAAFFSPKGRDLPKFFSDREGHWTGFSARARIILYNKNLVQEKDAPKSMMDLLSPKFRGKICIANPLFGTTSMHAAALFQVLGDKKAQEYFDGLAKNGVRIVSSNGEVRRRVAAGDFAIGIADTDDAFEAIRENKPVKVVYPDKQGMGTLIIPNAVVLIRKAPHEEAAKIFIDYLLTHEVEKKLAESDAAQMPVRASILVPHHVQPLSGIIPMQVRYEGLAEKLESLSRGYLKEWVSKNSR